MGIADELKRMTSTLFGGAESDGVTETASTEAPPTSAPTTEIPSEEFKTDAPGTDAPTTDVPDELTSLRAELEMLKSERSKPSKTTKAPSTDAPISDEDFMSGIDFDDVTRDASSFNSLLNKVFKKGVELARKESKTGSAGIMSALPNIVNSNLEVIQSLKKTSDDFYEANEDLKEFKQVVSTVFGEVASANTDKSYSEVLALTGNEVRNRLKLTKPVERTKPPKLPKAKGNTRPKSTEGPGGIASEIDAMNKVLNQ